MGTLLLLLGGAALWYAVKHRKSASVGRLSDDPLDLDSILMGVSRGWYTAKPQIMDGFGYVVWLSGVKANGEIEEDVFPITEETYNELMKRL